MGPEGWNNSVVGRSTDGFFNFKISRYIYIYKSLKFLTLELENSPVFLVFEY